MITGYFTKINRTYSPGSFEVRLNELPDDIKIKILSYSTLQERLSRLCGKLLLSKLLKDNGINAALSELNYNEFAKPYFHIEFDFNIAHSDNIVICILSEGFKIGVDIEKIKEIDTGALADYFTNKEVAAINTSSDKAASLLRMWVRKETAIKAIGKGSFQPMHEIEVYADSIQIDGSVIFLKDIFIEKGYAACIATTERDCDIMIREIDMDILLARSLNEDS